MHAEHSHAFAVRLAALLAPAAVAAAAEVIPIFPTGSGGAVSGVCFHEGDMFAVTRDNTLVHYDPVSGEALEVVAPLVPDLMQPHIHGITCGAGDTFWVGDTMTARLYQMRFGDWSLVSSVDAPPGWPPFGLGFENATLWLGYHSEGEPTPLLGLDPETGEVLATLDPGTSDAHGLAWVAGRLWVLDSMADALVQLDAGGQVIATHPLPDDIWNSLAYDGEQLWVASTQMFYHVELPVPVVEGDFDGDGQVGVTDFLALLAAWGACPDPPGPCAADLDGDGQVGVTDFLALLAAWG